MNKYQVVVSICLHLDGLSTHLSPLVRNFDGLLMALPGDLYFCCCLHKSGVIQAVKVAKKT